jgi:F-type H+-transporting ATPase subunit a
VTTAEASERAQTERAQAERPGGEQPGNGGGLSTKAKLGIFFAVYLGVAILLYAIFGSEGKNEEFAPEEEFKLDPWIELKIGGLDLSFNKAVLYLLLTCILTVGVMVYIAKRMQQRPNRVQTIVEGAFDLTYNQIAKRNMPQEAAAKWFPFVATLFFFIWFSNMIGYIPLPVNDHETIDIAGIDFPAFALYAATANLSIPLVLTLTVFGLYQWEGIRRHGLVKYLKGWLPAGVSGGAAVPIFIIEVVSQFVRIISLSVRLFANILAGHLLILFMGGGLAVLLGLAVLGWITLPIAVAFFIFEVGLIATLQAFIFATLTSIYFGEASAGGH